MEKTEILQDTCVPDEPDSWETLITKMRPFFSEYLEPGIFIVQSVYWQTNIFLNLSGCVL